MELIRSFVAIELPKTLKKEISQYISIYKKIQDGIKWIEPNNLHITLKFIGERSLDLTASIKTALNMLNYSSTAFRIEIGDIDTFPNRSKARVLFLKLKSNPIDALTTLQSSIESKVESIGIERGKQNFSAHLTIGRNKNSHDLKRLWDYLNKHPIQLDSFNVQSFSLIKSVLMNEGPQYTNLQNYSLK